MHLRGHSKIEDKTVDISENPVKKETKTWKNC
jgi:hypothetical protein